MAHQTQTNLRSERGSGRRDQFGRSDGHGPGEGAQGSNRTGQTKRPMGDLHNYHKFARGGVTCMYRSGRLIHSFARSVGMALEGLRQRSALETPVEVTSLYELQCRALSQIAICLGAVGRVIIPWLRKTCVQDEQLSRVPRPCCLCQSFQGGIPKPPSCRNKSRWQRSEGLNFNYQGC